MHELIRYYHKNRTVKVMDVETGTMMLIRYRVPAHRRLYNDLVRQKPGFLFEIEGDKILMLGYIQDEEDETKDKKEKEGFAVSANDETVKVVPDISKDETAVIINPNAKSKKDKKEKKIKAVINKDGEEVSAKKEEAPEDKDVVEIITDEDGKQWFVFKDGHQEMLDT